MYVAVRQRGGFLGLDRTVEIDEGKVLVTENGVARPAAALDESQRARIEELVGGVIKSTDAVVTFHGSTPSDSMDTRIEVDDGSRRRTVQLRSGDQAPTEVWELLGAVGRVSSPAAS